MIPDSREEVERAGDPTLASLLVECRTRDEAAEVYADALRKIPLDDIEKWSALNARILARWSRSGLIYIKTKAWKIARALVVGPVS